MFNLNTQDNWYFCTWLYLNIKPYVISYSRTEENGIIEVPWSRQSVLTRGQKEKEKNKHLRRLIRTQIGSTKHVSFLFLFFFLFLAIVAFVISKLKRNERSLEKPFHRVFLLESVRTMY